MYIPILLQSVHKINKYNNNIIYNIINYIKLYLNKHYFIVILPLNYNINIIIYKYNILLKLLI